MTLSVNISTRQLALGASVYFALLGLFDIGMDIYHNSLSPLILLFNLFFFVPIIFRNKTIHLLFGVLFSLLWIYLIFGALSIAVLTKQTGLKEISIGLFLLFSLGCSLLLIYRGLDLSTNS